MTRKISVLFLILLFLFCAAASAQTVDEIIAKHLAARGGVDKIKAVQSMKASGKMMMQGMEAPFTIRMKRPNEMRMEIDVQGKTIVRGYDGKEAWMIMPFMGSPDPQRLSSEETKEVEDDADIDGPLVDYQAKGNKVELLGKEDMEGTEVYKLKVTLKSGSERIISIDGESFLELKSTSKVTRNGQEFEVDTTVSNYKPVNGLMFPFAVESKANGQTMQQMTVDSYEVDIPMEESIFKMPAAAAQPANQ